MSKKLESLLKKEGGNYLFPFFWQHGEDEETLRTYMKVIDEANIGAVCVESRPHPDFCGPKWWEDMDIILDEARKRGMKVWILDDSHFPTGFANGAMAEQPKELYRQSICCRSYECAPGMRLEMDSKAIEHPDDFKPSRVEAGMFQMNGAKEEKLFDDDRLLAIYAVRFAEDGDGFREEKYRVNLKEYIKDGCLYWEVPKGKWKVYTLHLTRNRGPHRNYINMMDRASCRVLIDAVYEPHWEHYAKDFGTTIEGFFSDEPELGNGHLYDKDNVFGTAPDMDYPWSAELEERLLQELGENFGEMLALLWENGADAETTARVRYAYMDNVTRLVEEDFSRQIGTWCREKGVRYIGHLIEDNGQHARTCSSLGHYFRGLAGQDMAGIDDIGGQVFPQGEDVCYDKGPFMVRNGEFYHYMLGKLGASAAAIEPLKKGNSMCEIFGAYGWGEGVRLEKYLIDHFLVRGINHYVPHAFSAKAFPDPDCPPHFYAHGHNPQYRHFGSLMAYTNRVCELISGGKHVSVAAVLYHGEGEWTGKYMPSEKAGHVLSDAQIEYDYIPQDVFARRADYRTAVEKGLLRVNTQEYRAVVIPYMQFITQALAEAAAEMISAGIPVLFVEGLPEGLSCGRFNGDCAHNSLMELLGGAEIISLEDTAQRLKKAGVTELSISPADNRIRYYHYEHQDESAVYLFVNEGTATYSGTFCLKEGRIPYLYDAWDNCIRPVSFERKGQGEEICLNLTVSPLKSVIVIFDSQDAADAMLACASPAPMAEGEQLQFDNVWKRSLCKSREYPDFVETKEISLPDSLAQEQPLFSGFVRYENTFSARRGQKVVLEITDAYEGVEVFLNGTSLGIQVAPVFCYDLSPEITDGENTLAIEVATTLEREMSAVPNRMAALVGLEAKPECPSGINGEVRLWLER